MFLGNFTEDITLLGTGLQIGAGIFNLDLLMDIRDLTADFCNWEWSWGHLAQTTLDLVGLLPVVGVLKYGDEAFTLAKHGDELALAGGDVLKYADDVSEEALKAGKNITPNVSTSEKIVETTQEAIKGGTEPNFYVGPNGKALPSQYKDWIGTNIQKELLDQAENPQLQNAIKQLYRGNSFIGDGGTADVIRFEQQTGLMLGKNGGSHVQKGIDMAKYIENKILTQDLSPSDRALATQLLEDLYSALGR